MLPKQAAFLSAFSLAFFGTRAGFALKKSVRLVREVWYRAVHAQDICASRLPRVRPRSCPSPTSADVHELLCRLGDLTRLLFQFYLHARQHSSKNRLGRSEARISRAHPFVKRSRVGIGLDYHPNRAETSGPSRCPLEQQATNS